jgi:hypothetical protein
MTKVTDALVLQMTSPAELAAVNKILKAHFPLWELVGNKVYVAQSAQSQAKVNWKWITLPVDAWLVRALIKLDSLIGVGAPVDIDVDLTNPNNTVALMDIRLYADDNDVMCIGFTFRLSFVPTGKKGNKVVNLSASFVLTEVQADVQHVTDPLDIPGLASGAIGKELFEVVANVLQRDYPMWELEDGKVYITENFQSVAEVIYVYKGAGAPVEEIISLPINAYTLHQLLRRNHDSEVGVLVDADFDIDNPNHKIHLLDIYICSESDTPQIGFIFQVNLATRNSSTRKPVNLHALYPLPVLPLLPLPSASFDGDEFTDSIKTTKTDSIWENLVAALIFSCTDYGTLEEFIINIKGSFFITPIVNVEGTALVRTDAEMDDVVNMFQDVGYKYPDLLAIFHLIQYLRLSNDNKLKLASVSFNYPDKTSRYILSQPF